MRKCLTKKCDDTQRCEEPEEEHPDHSATCVCKEDYVTITMKDNSTKCELFDPCKPEHQPDNAKVCGDEAKCWNLGQGNFRCQCPDGKHIPNRK